jgi:FkbM family methyltransferase
VGANIGLYTLEGSIAVGKSGRVVSIEAAPPNVAILKKNVQLNDLTNVSIVEAAVGNSSGEAVLTLPTESNRGMYTLGSVDGDRTYSVAVRTIDGLMEELNIDFVDLVKMDIEGSEYQALCGTVRTLERCKPVLFVELNETALSRCRSSSTAVKRLLRGLGYNGWLIARHAVRPLLESQSIHTCDECLFIHRDNKSLIRQLRLPTEGLPL